jgi:integrase
VDTSIWSDAHPPHSWSCEAGQTETAARVHALIARKTHEGRLAPRTIQYMHSVLRAALNQALRWRMVHYNAAAMVSAPHGTRFEPRVLTPQEARRLLDAARGERLEALYSVALALGLRQGEALGLKWSDIDMEPACCGSAELLNVSRIKAVSWSRQRRHEAAGRSSCRRSSSKLSATIEHVRSLNGSQPATVGSTLTWSSQA